MKRKINKKDIIFFIAILLFITSQILPNEVNNLDEIWNFNFANCIANGLVPYKEFNLIQGPLLPFICGIFLKIFGQEMIVMRVLAIIMDTVILFMVYKIMSKLKIKCYITYMVLIISAIIMKPYFTIDYNWATLFVVLVLIYLEIKQEKANWKRNLITGIIAGITITLKQTTGLVIVIIAIGYKILEVRNYNDFKEYIKGALQKMLGALIVVLIFMIVLLKLGALNDYIDYCILGIATFSNKISYIDGLIASSNILIRVLSVCPILVYVCLIYNYINKHKKEILTLLLFSLATMIVVYPILDESHFVIAIIPTLISIGYLLNILCEKIKIPQKEEIAVASFLESLLVITSIFYFLHGINLYSVQNKNIELSHFTNLPMSSQAISSIKEIDEFIERQEKEVIILDATAALYMIPINRYNKNYDMFLKGNLGSKGEEGQIENLKNLPNKMILIMNQNYQRNWQNPEQVRSFIQTEMTKTGEIGIFDIYE